GMLFVSAPIVVSAAREAFRTVDPKLERVARTLGDTGWGAFRRVTLPLALPGVFAGSLLTFIPAMGDYINAELLGSPGTRMIGNVIQNRLLVQNDYPVGSALSFVLMAGILVAVAIYARLLGTEQLTG
ncbi:MAG TPA: ABC transporter permease subunit, partial [Candidatus Limnocylindrales bacterium]